MKVKTRSKNLFQAEEASTKPAKFQNFDNKTSNKLNQSSYVKNESMQCPICTKKVENIGEHIEEMHSKIKTEERENKSLTLTSKTVKTNQGHRESSIGNNIKCKFCKKLFHMKNLKRHERLVKNPITVTIVTKNKSKRT